MRNKPRKELPETEQIKRGLLLVEVLNLEKDFEHADRWRTTWGTKTALGLYLTVKRILEEGK